MKLETKFLIGSIIFFLVISISSITAYFVSKENIIVITNQQEMGLKLGTITSDCDFPNVNCTFNDNDIINAGPINALFWNIGEIGTTSPKTLRYLVTNTNSNNITYSGHLTITSASSTNQTITNLWGLDSCSGAGCGTALTTNSSIDIWGMKSRYATSTFGIITNASTTYATLPTFWGTTGTITNASSTYLSIATNGWLNSNPIVSNVTGNQTQLAAFSGTDTITPTSTIGLSLISGLGTIASQNSNNVSITGGSITGITDLVVADGGTGVSTFTSNGVLYGNGAGAIQVTAQGGANSVLTANAGAPSFSSSPTLTALTVTNATTTGSFFFPIGTFSLSQSGQVMLNTTDETLRWQSPVATQVISATSTFGFSVSSTTASELIHLKYFDKAATITKLMCNVVGGTSFTFNMRYNNDITSDSAVKLFTSDQAVSTTTTYYASAMANSTPAAGNSLWLTTSAISGVVRYSSCTGFYKISP